MSPTRVGNQDGRDTFDPDQPVRDPYRLWERLLETDPRAKPEWLNTMRKSWDRIRILRDRQQEFNDARLTTGTKSACTGIRIKGFNDLGQTHQCKELFCPGRWWLTQAKIQSRILEIEAPYWYFRATSPIEWTQDFDPGIMRWFRAHHQCDFRTVGWTIAVEPGTNPEGIATCYYRYVGVWCSVRPIQQREVQAVADNKAAQWTEVEWYDSREAVLDRWVQENSHPGHLRDLPDYRDGTVLASLNRRIRTRRYVGNSEQINRFLDQQIRSERQKNFEKASEKKLKSCSQQQ